MDLRDLTVVMVGDRVRHGVSLRSVVTQNHDRLQDAILRCYRSESTVQELLSESRCITAVPVIERTRSRVHGVWVCTHRTGEQPKDPAPSWAFLWDLTEGFAYRGDPVGMSSSWADLDIPTRRPIADALRAFDLGERNTSALAALVSKSDADIDRYTATEHRPSGVRKVHFVAHPATEDTAGRCDLQGLSIDIGEAPEPTEAGSPSLGDRIADALTPQRRYRAISDPDTLNLLYWHGTPAPRIAWMADNTVDAPILYAEDRAAAMRTVELLRRSSPGHKVEMTVRFLTVDGTYEPIEVTVSIIELESGQTALLVVLTIE